MNAHEFVKQHGWGEAIRYSKMIGLSNVCGCSIDDLKRIVESHELVEIYTRRFNRDAEWFFVSEYCKKNRISPFFSENYNKASGIYKQAILDVEACQ